MLELFFWESWELPRATIASSENIASSDNMPRDQGPPPQPYGPDRDHWDKRWQLYHAIVGSYPESISELPVLRAEDGPRRPPLTLLTHDFFGKDLFILGEEGLPYCDEVGITRIVNCTSNVEFDLPWNIRSVRFIFNHVLNISDKSSPEGSQFVTDIRMLVNWCRGHRTGIACEHGLHRSAGTAAAFLMTQGYSLQHAVQFLEMVRPRADLSHESVSKEGKRRLPTRNRLARYEEALRNSGYPRALRQQV